MVKKERKSERNYVSCAVYQKYSNSHYKSNVTSSDRLQAWETKNKFIEWQIIISHQ